MFDKSLQESLHHATQFTRKLKNEFVSLEHFLHGSLKVKELEPFFKDHGVDLKHYSLKLETFIKKAHPKIKRVDSNYNPEPTMGLHRCIDRALKQAQSSGKTVISALHILLSIFEETESYALFVLEEMGLSPLIIMEHITENGSSIEASPQSTSGKDPLKQYCTNLNLKFNKGDSPKLIGRTQELSRVLEVLSRKNKNNPLLVGDPGVGKTAIGEGLAELVTLQKAPPKFKDLEVFSLDLSALLAGAKYRGDFEGRLKSLFKSLREIKNPLLLIDEIHSIVGAGSTSGGSIDLAGLLKPVLTDPHIKVLGSTTYSEYRKHFAKDQALSRRFQAVFVEEPSEDETLKILNGVKEDFEGFHGLEIDDEAIVASVKLAGKHILDRKFPDKAFDVLDETCAFRTTQNDRKVIFKSDVEDTMVRVFKISDQITKESNDDLISSLEIKLKNKIFGQDQAIEALTDSMMIAYSGLNDDEKPLGSFLFTGPTGVGKTELTKQLANHLGLPLIKFDMSEYMEKHSVSKLIGAPPGYVGHDDGGRLTDEVSKNPNAVLLLDEIEKAHPDVINVLLQVMDSASLTDSIGKTTHFNRSIIVMTSNSGARAAQKGSVGIYEAPTHDFSDEAIKSFFSPEFINRLTAIIKFNSLETNKLVKVIEKNLLELKNELLKKEVDLEWDKSILNWILENGAETHMGARPFARFISKNIKVEIAKKMISHKKSSDRLKLSLSLDGKKKLQIFEV